MSFGFNNKEFIIDWWECAITFRGENQVYNCFKSECNIIKWKIVQIAIQ